jgi:hypothetical protein
MLIYTHLPSLRFGTHLLVCVQEEKELKRKRQNRVSELAK